MLVSGSLTLKSRLVTIIQASFFVCLFPKTFLFYVDLTSSSFSTALRIFPVTPQFKGDKFDK